MKIFSFFFSSRRRHTRCALGTGVQTCALPISSPFFFPLSPRGRGLRSLSERSELRRSWVRGTRRHRLAGSPAPQDRKSVVQGKSVSVRVDLGGRRILNKNTQQL